MNRKGLSFKLGSNHMLDWSDAEHRSIRGKIYSTRKPMFGEPSNLDASVLREMPRSLDLRILGRYRLLTLYWYGLLSGMIR